MKKKIIIVELIQEWLKENNLQIEKRPYSHAFDAKDNTGKKTSFGVIASQKIAQELDNIIYI